MRFLLLGFIAVGAFGQQRSVILTWDDNINPSGTSYSVYRAPGLCSGSPVFAKIAQGVTDKTYTDSPVSPGRYCYHVTSVLESLESEPSNTASAPVPPQKPTNVQAVVP